MHGVRRLHQQTSRSKEAQHISAYLGIPGRPRKARYRGGSTCPPSCALNSGEHDFALVRHTTV
ncbi:hypothetical protein E2C01_051200 [Portunus trituberculatus]|uniref:Uncharacterized protein n=1 Tax=Portunus trituberculatus TaxID=210409 RepID=A0A5B7GL41_PORTR|nr:hypothetical protein [Portunus trituberculatus]